jgi:hypothetical protein
MTENSSSTRSKSRTKKKRRGSSRFLSTLRTIWRDWWIEIIVVILVALAIFLLVERMDIRQTIFGWGAGLFRALERLATKVINGLAAFVRGTTLSDLIAYLLLLVVAALVIWRVRWRLLTSPRLNELVCPECGGDLHRTHRHWPDRVVGLLVPVRRYRCKNQDCLWSGLRIREDRHR